MYSLKKSFLSKFKAIVISICWEILQNIWISNPGFRKLPPHTSLPHLGFPSFIPDNYDLYFSFFP